METTKRTLIRKELEENPNRSNGEIARKLKLENKDEFVKWEIDSIRRNVSKVRNKKFPETITDKTENDFKESYTEHGDTAEKTKIVGEQVKTLADLIRICEIETEIWSIDRWECSVYHMYSRLRKYDGKERTSDTGTVTPLYRVKCYLKR